jgi:hypothetical protein
MTTLHKKLHVSHIRRDLPICCAQLNPATATPIAAAHLAFALVPACRIRCMCRLALVGHAHAAGSAPELVAQVIFAVNANLRALALATLGSSCEQEDTDSSASKHNCWFDSDFTPHACHAWQQLQVQSKPLTEEASPTLMSGTNHRICCAWQAPHQLSGALAHAQNPCLQQQASPQQLLRIRPPPPPPPNGQTLTAPAASSSCGCGSFLRISAARCSACSHASSQSASYFWLYW